VGDSEGNYDAGKATHGVGAVIPSRRCESDSGEFGRGGRYGTTHIAIVANGVHKKLGDLAVIGRAKHDEVTLTLEPFRYSLVIAGVPFRESERLGLFAVVVLGIRIDLERVAGVDVEGKTSGWWRDCGISIKAEAFQSCAEVGHNNGELVDEVIVWPRSVGHGRFVPLSTEIFFMGHEFGCESRAD